MCEHECVTIFIANNEKFHAGMTFLYSPEGSELKTVKIGFLPPIFLQEVAYAQYKEAML